MPELINVDMTIAAKSKPTFVMHLEIACALPYIRKSTDDIDTIGYKGFEQIEMARTLFRLRQKTVFESKESPERKSLSKHLDRKNHSGHSV